MDAPSSDDFKDAGALSLAGETVRARVHSVYDADTLTVLCQPEWSARVLVVKVRVVGVDSPEIRAKDPTAKALAYEGRAFARELLLGQCVKLEGLNRCPWGREVCRVWLDDGRDYSELLISENLASAYSGKGPKTTKEEWAAMAARRATE